MGTIHHQIATSGAQSWDFASVPVKEYTSGDATAGSTRRVLIGRDEGAEDVAEFEGPYLDPANHEPHGQGQKDRQFRVGAKGVQQGIHDETFVDIDCLSVAPADAVRGRARPRRLRRDVAGQGVGQRS